MTIAFSSWWMCPVRTVRVLVSLEIQLSIHTVLFSLGSCSVGVVWKHFIHPLIASCTINALLLLKCLPKNSITVEPSNCRVLIATWLSLNHNELHITVSLWNLHSRQQWGCADQCNCSGSLTASISTAYWLFFFFSPNTCPSTVDRDRWFQASVCFFSGRHLIL